MLPPPTSKSLQSQHLLCYCCKRSSETWGGVERTENRLYDLEICYLSVWILGKLKKRAGCYGGSFLCPNFYLSLATLKTLSWEFSYCLMFWQHSNFRNVINLNLKWQIGVWKDSWISYSTNKQRISRASPYSFL